MSRAGHSDDGAAQGNDLHRLHELELAGWFDFWLGWSGQLEDSH
jgi:hypothetical protein